MVCLGENDNERLMIEAWDWTRILVEFHDPLRRYVEFGIVPEGRILTAVLANQLSEALLHYDESYASHVRRLVVFIRHYLPAQSWGCAENVAGWEEQGGFYRCKRPTDEIAV